MVQLQIQEKVGLASYSTWQVGGVAEYFCLPKNEDELRQAMDFSREKKIPISVLGGGSNVLISDAGVDGLIICLQDLSGVLVSEARGNRWVIEAMAGTSKSDLLKIFLKQKLAPAIFLAGIPGDLGGGVVMNAGVGEMLTPKEFVEITDWIEIMRPDGGVEELRNQQLQWGYRHCEGWQPGIIMKVGLSWKNEANDAILVQARTANHVRMSRQPLDMPSCGSVFVNPPGHKAAMLIDSCGLKGYTLGNVQVSTKHANFILNLGGARSMDIWLVIQHVQNVVRQKTGIELKTEVVRLGKW